MAERRMFTKKVTDDDNFAALSASAQALYLHLSMAADDDGFCNQVSASMFKAHASVQDLQALLERRYIYQFENGVIVIKHWRMANALRKDRYTPTAFQRELSLLKIKKNGSYTISGFDDSAMITLQDDNCESSQETARQIAYRNSELPYSFDYKIRQAFYGKVCPICGNKMQKTVDETGIVSENRLPTIQHNKPISKGGKHELGNISVICHQCNVTIQDTETGELNASEVVAEWEKITGCRLVAACLPQDSIDKGRVVEGSIEQDNNNSFSLSKKEKEEKKENDLSAVMSFFLDHIEPQPYAGHIDFVKASIETKGPERVLDALKKCVETGKTSFPWIMKAVNEA